MGGWGASVPSCLPPAGPMGGPSVTQPDHRWGPRAPVASVLVCPSVRPCPVRKDGRASFSAALEPPPLSGARSGSEARDDELLCTISKAGTLL